MSDEQEREPEILVPIMQDTIIFNDHPLIVLRLPGGEPAVVLRWICENLHLSPSGQVERIKRTEVIADDLVYARVLTDGGPQIMPTLLLHSVPYWLATIDTRKMAKDDPRRLEVLNYQRHVVDALYQWAQSPKVIEAPTNLVSAERITKPTRPSDDADLDEWSEYHQQMVLWINWKRDIEQWRGNVESRLEGLEEVTNLIPEILERLGPHTLTPDHQRAVQKYVQLAHEATSRSYGTIYDQLKTAFGVSRYSDIPDLDWPRVASWFQAQIEQGRKR